MRLPLEVLMLTSIRKLGNSQGVIIPKTVLTQLGFEGVVEMRVTEAGIWLEKPKTSVREGWAEASKGLAAAGDDALVWPEITNEDDEALTW
jgi:antitoxin MazE